MTWVEEDGGQRGLKYFCLSWHIKSQNSQLLKKIPYIIISSSCLIIGKSLEKRKHFQYLFLHGTILRGFPYIWYLWSIEFFQHCPIVSIVILKFSILFNCLYIVLHIDRINCHRVVLLSPSHYDDNELCWSPLIWWLRPLYIIHVLSGLQLIKEDKLGQVSNPNSNWYNRRQGDRSLLQGEKVLKY